MGNIYEGQYLKNISHIERLSNDPRQKQAKFNKRTTNQTSTKIKNTELIKTKNMKDREENSGLHIRSTQAF